MVLLGIVAFFVIIFLVCFISDKLHGMAERRFTRGLNKPGMAAQLRETVSQVVRESAVLVSVNWKFFLHLILLFHMFWMLFFFSPIECWLRRCCSCSCWTARIAFCKKLGGIDEIGAVGVYSNNSPDMPLKCPQKWEIYVILKS